MEYDACHFLFLGSSCWQTILGIQLKLLIAANGAGIAQRQNANLADPVKNCKNIPPIRIKWNGIFTYLNLPMGAEWMMFGVQVQHPLGFKQHPLEDAGT